MTTIFLHHHITYLGMVKSIYSSAYPRAANLLASRTDLGYFARVRIFSSHFWYIWQGRENFFWSILFSNIDFLLLVVVQPKFSVFSKHAAMESETNILFHENVWNIYGQLMGIVIALDYFIFSPLWRFIILESSCVVSARSSFDQWYSVYGRI